ncbi:class I SAM-dependent methyltransferase [Nocardiopsis gilva]
MPPAGGNGPAPTTAVAAVARRADGVSPRCPRESCKGTGPTSSAPSCGRQPERTGPGTPHHREGATLSPAPPHDAYSRGNPTLRFLEEFGWGDLVSLGRLTPLTLPWLVGGRLDALQRRLARDSLALLRHRRGQRVLDACCGRGYAAAALAGSGCTAVGLDVLPAQISQARQRFGQGARLGFAVADVRAPPARVEGIDLGDASFDRIHCLEAAFHFGPPGRSAFLMEGFRLLRPGGRLVLVDITWRGEDPHRIDRVDPARLVRDTWQFDEFEPRTRYPRLARRAGFTVHKVLDWSNTVTRPWGQAAALLGRIAATPLGRAALRARRPGLGDLTLEEWRHLADVARAHHAVASSVSYTALVLDKPV